MAFKIKRKKRPEEEIPLSSTADIAFLLIIFYMVGSALLELHGVQLQLPKKDAPPMEILKKDIMKLGVDKNGHFLHENKPYDAPALEKLVKEEHAKNKDLVIVLRISREAPSRAVPEIVHTLQNAGVTRLSMGLEGK